MIILKNHKSCMGLYRKLVVQINGQDERMIVMLDTDEIFEEEKEIPSFVLPNLITWLRDKGHSDSEVLDCIMCICGSGNER